MFTMMYPPNSTNTLEIRWPNIWSLGPDLLVDSGQEAEKLQDLLKEVSVLIQTAPRRTNSDETRGVKHVKKGDFHGIAVGI